MKQKIFFLIFASLVIWGSVHGQHKDIPFNKGFNLHDWFENFDDITDIKFKKFIRQDFENMKALGCDHIRLPVEFFDATGPAPDFTIDPMFFMFIDEVVNWAEELEMYLIIDNHSFSDRYITLPEVADTLLAIWPQVAARYKSHSDFILYEILNEPHGIYDETWNDIQQEVLEAIRELDQKHTIILGASNWYNYNHLHLMPEFSDTNLIYTFHFYDPFLFTAASEVVIPYPYDPVRMPDMPIDWVGDWYEELYNEYPSQANDEYLYKLIDTVVNFREERNVPVYCGEFGVNMVNSEVEDRAYWIETVRGYLEENNISWAMWTYTDYMGIFDPATPQLFEYNMDTIIARALGLTPPAQKEFQILPDSAGFFLYDDYLPQYIIENSWANGGTSQYYSQNNPKVGDFCISWTDADQYGNLGFRFYPIRDLSQLRANGFMLDFWVQCDAPEVQIELRFEDTDTGLSDHPWRSSVILDENLTDFYGSWSHVSLPLTEFVETGAWEDNVLHEPEGKFDWTRIERFDFVAEYSNLNDIDFFFDQIQIIASSTNTSNSSILMDDYNNPKLNVFSNPESNNIHVNFTIAESLSINIDLINTLGQRLGLLANGVYNSGTYTIDWNCDKLATGTYIIRLQSSNCMTVRKIIISP